MSELEARQDKERVWPDFHYEILPEHMREGMKLYLEHGIEPGSFGVAVLCNDLVGAFGAADRINTSFMEDWARWLYNHCPSSARGSTEQVRRWIESGGLKGREGLVNERTTV